ncbi:hypothetical protein OPQ81_006818 [Rhizoctonia solani]|nr:hypothetical protein OPQ81_006818 [Rhizoctonia solani]
MDPAAITEQLATFYYQALSGDRSQLANIYKGDSILTWEGNQFQGAGAIVEKHTAFPTGVQFKVVTKDFQIAGDKMIVLVTGQLITEPGANPVHFSQSFTLAADGVGGFYVANDLFRLNYDIYLSFPLNSKPIAKCGNSKRQTVEKDETHLFLRSSIH